MPVGELPQIPQTNGYENAAGNNQEEPGQRNNYPVENGEEQSKQFDMFWRRFVKRLRLL